MNIKVIQAPIQEPITLAEARLHLRLTTVGSPATHPDDDWITTIGLPAARDYCEGWLGRALAPQVYEMAFDAFPTGDIVLAMPPIFAIQSIIYLDADGVEQTLATTEYTLNDYIQPAQVHRTFDTIWPTTQVIENAVKVRFLAGYSLQGESPQVEILPYALKAAILLVLAHLYENREQTTMQTIVEIPLGAQALMERYRIRLSIA